MSIRVELQEEQFSQNRKWVWLFVIILAVSFLSQNVVL